ncbi:aminotransferase class III-fold pyridoxal phosphate-dependent enzyme, partial [Campylobacter coli]
ERVFFTNSGAESIEGAMKVARKYAFNKGIKGGNFIAFKHSFHIANWLKNLPFSPTRDQLNALKDIEQDLGSKEAKRRVIMGDVG